MSTNATDLAAWLSELEKEVAEKAVVIASIRQRLGMDPTVPLAGVVTPSVGAAGSGMNATFNGDVSSLRSDTFYRMTLPDAIKKFLDMAKRPQGPKIIADAMLQGGILSQSGNFPVMVASTLKRMRSRGILVNNKEGWGLADWYSGRGKPPEPPPSRRPKKRGSKGKKAATSRPATGTQAKKSNHSGYNDFMAERRRAGKSMAEIAVEWQAQKQSK
jgi:hypothetical protein